MTRSILCGIIVGMILYGCTLLAHPLESEQAEENVVVIDVEPPVAEPQEDRIPEVTATPSPTWGVGIEQQPFRNIREEVCRFATNMVLMQEDNHWCEYSTDLWGYYETFDILNSYVADYPNPGRLSCCGFATYCVQAITGVDIYRTLCRDLATLYADQLVSYENAQQGDILLFNDDRGWYHAAVYLGDGQMAHCTENEEVICITSVYGSPAVLPISTEIVSPITDATILEVLNYDVSRGSSN